MEEEYEEMAVLIENAQVHIFPNGGHPAIASNAEEAARLIKDFVYMHVKLNI